MGVDALQEVRGMAVTRANAFWLGLLMIIGGAVWLMDAAGAVRLGDAWVAMPFALAGFGFGVAWARDRRHWWAAIPAGGLFGIGAVIAWEELVPPSAAEWGAALFLGILGVGFAGVYFRAREQWWSIIPAGVLLSVALLVGATEVLPELQSVAILFAGLSVTFGLLAIAPVGGRPMRWALIPAIPLAVLAIAFAAGAIGALEILEDAWPLILVAGGMFLLWRGFSERWEQSRQP